MKTSPYQDLSLKLAPLLNALSHPARLQIMLYLVEFKNCPAGNISNLLPLSQSTVSQHMAKLKESGLITCNPEGNCLNYHISDTGVDLLKVMFNELIFLLTNGKTKEPDYLPKKTSFC